MAIWRQRLVRSALLATAGVVACAAVFAYQATGSSAVRRQVTNHLHRFFVGGEVALGSAHFRLLGGVSVENFTLYRLDDPSRTPVLHVPSGVIYHDKEALAHGRLAVRKLLMRRPRLTVTRTADGRWNLAGILGPLDPELQIPIMEVEQATVDVEIATAATAQPIRLELRNVNATLLNQPKPVLNIEIRGEAVALGPIHVDATWHRTESRLDAAADVAPVPVTMALVRELARSCPDLVAHVEDIGGVARLHAGVQYRQGASPAWHSQLRADVTGGRLVDRDLPLTLDDIRASARCDDGVLGIDRFTASAGAADVILTCRLQSPDTADALAHRGENSRATPHPATLIPASLDRLAALDLTVKHLAVTPELFPRLPFAFQKYQQVYAPTGPADLTVKLDRPAGVRTLTAVLKPLGMAGRYDAFPYPVHEVRGRLGLTVAGDRPPRLEVDLTAEANGRRPVTVQGHVEGEGPAPEYAITVTSDAVALDETLLQALPAKFQAVARSYHPVGRCDVTARLDRRSGASQPTQQFAVGFRGDTAVCFDQFPVPLDRLSGHLDVTLGPDQSAHGSTWLCRFNDIRGTYAGARIAIVGQARPTVDGTRVDLTIAGRGLPLDETLAAAFDSPRMRLRPIWEMFRPAGRFDFTAEVMHTDRQTLPADFDIRVRHNGATVTPTFFPMEFDDLAGSFRCTPGRVEVDHYTARHGPTRFEFGGASVRFGGGGYSTDLRGLRAEPLPIDTKLVAALPPALQSVCHALEPAGAVAVDLDRLVIDHPPELPGPAEPPVLYWDGRVTFADAALRTGVAWTGVTGVVASQGRYRGQVLDRVNGHVALDRATVFGQPLAGLHADAWVVPDQPHELRLRLNRGQIFGGQLDGEAHVAFGAGLHYEMDLKAIGVQLEDAARHNHVGTNARISGAAKAELYVTGTGEGLDDLGGGGNLHVPNGKMYNLPLVLDLLKVMSLRAPDRTAFEEAHAEFKIHGKRVVVQRLDLLGGAVSLGGKGEMDLDGSNLAMDFYAVWGHITQVLPPGLRELPPWLSKNLLLLKAHGSLTGPVTVWPMVAPPLTDPLRQLVDKVRARTAGGKTAAGGVRAQKD